MIAVKWFSYPLPSLQVLACACLLPELQTAEWKALEKVFHPLQLQEDDLTNEKNRLSFPYLTTYYLIYLTLLFNVQLYIIFHQEETSHTTFGWSFVSVDFQWKRNIVLDNESLGISMHK